MVALRSEMVTGTSSNLGPMGCAWRYPKYASAATDGSSLYQFLRESWCTRVCWTQYRSKVTGLRQQDAWTYSRQTPNGPNEMTYVKVRYGSTAETGVGTALGRTSAIAYVDYMKVMYCHNRRNSPRDSKGVELSNMKCRVKKAGGLFKICIVKVSGLKDQTWGFGKGWLPKGKVSGNEYILAEPLCCDKKKPCSTAFKDAYTSRLLPIYTDPKTWSALDQHSMLAF